jgi:hypothetical protein
VSCRAKKDDEEDTYMWARDVIERDEVLVEIPLFGKDQIATLYRE